MQKVSFSVIFRHAWLGLLAPLFDALGQDARFTDTRHKIETVRSRKIWWVELQNVRFGDTRNKKGHEPLLTRIFSLSHYSLPLSLSILRHIRAPQSSSFSARWVPYGRWRVIFASVCDAERRLPNVSMWRVGIEKGLNTHVLKQGPVTFQSWPSFNYLSLTASAKSDSSAPLV